MPKKRVLLFLLIFLNWQLAAQVIDTARKSDSVSITPAPGVDSIKKDSAIVNIPYSVSGKVIDANTAEGIPFAIVYFLHSNIGTTADLDGKFVINVDTLPSDSIHFEALGYTALNRKVKPGQHTLVYNLQMERADNVLHEVTVRAIGEDPALVLMRHIIEHKADNNPDKFENYSYEAYNRLEADLQGVKESQFSKIPILKSYSFIYKNLDTVSEADPYLPIYMTESISDFYFRGKPKKQREFIKATMMKGVNNENVTKYLGTMYQNINVYRNFLPVFDKKFVSPISNDGPFYYKYKIIDTQQAYGHRIILVSFRPRRDGESCFKGDFWVVDTSFAIQRVSMDVPKVANLNWVDKVSLYQEFAPFDSSWFFVKDKFIAHFTIYNAKKLPAFIGRKTTTYHHIKLNDTATEAVLENPDFKEEIIKMDSSKNRKDDWWEKNRPDSLSKNEKAINKMMDTINNMKITTVYKNAATFLISGVKDFGYLQLGPYYYIYSTNPVEGNRFRLSFGTSRKFKDEHFTGYVAYGDHDNRFKYGATGLWLMKRHPRTYLYGYYLHDLSDNANYYGEVSADNIFSTLFRKAGVPWKQAFSDDKRFEYYKEYYSGFSHKLVLQNKTFTPYNSLPSAGIFTDSKGMPASSVTSTEAGLELRYAYREKYIEGQYLRVNLGSKYPVVRLTTTAGLKDVLGSTYQYVKSRFSVSESINIPPFGHLEYVAFAGKYFANTALPYPLLEIHPGNEYYIYNPSAFEMMNRYEFISDQYAGFNIDHNIGGGIFNHIPKVKLLKLRQFWTAKGVIGSLDAQNQQLNLNKGYPFRTLAGEPYLELGTGISNIFQVFRLDFVWRVTPQPLATEARSKYFGIFLSGNFQF